MFQSLAIAVAGGLAVTPPLPPDGHDHVGEAYEITMVRETAQQSSGQSSGTSYDKDTIVERVLAERPDGLELEYDLPQEATAEEKDNAWQFPARVFRSNDGSLKLLNGAELESRVTKWLKAANWPRAVCGHWIFTWNAFRIDCDPRSVIDTIQAFDMWDSKVREGATYSETGAQGSGTLRRLAAGPNGATFSVELPIDAEAVRRARAESDVAVGEIMQKPVTLEAALEARAKEIVTGAVTITFETDPSGSVIRKTKVTKLSTQEPDGQIDSETVTQTLARRKIDRLESGAGSAG